LKLTGEQGELVTCTRALHRASSTSTSIREPIRFLLQVPFLVSTSTLQVLTSMAPSRVSTTEEKTSERASKTRLRGSQDWRYSPRIRSNSQEKKPESRWQECSKIRLT
jgi:hypothetical protein